MLTILIECLYGNCSATGRFPSTPSSFGSIGTPAASSPAAFFPPASGASSPATQEFGGALLRPSVLDQSPFRANESVSSATFRLADLGGEVHDPKSTKPDFVEAAGESPFGFPGALRSPSSRAFDRGHDATRGLPITRPRNFTGTPRALGGLLHESDFDGAGAGTPPMRTSSSSFDLGTVTSTGSALYPGSPRTPSLSSAFLGRGSEDPFFSDTAMRWPAPGGDVTARKKPPPGLSPPKRETTLGALHTDRDNAIQGRTELDANASAYEPFAGNLLSSGAFGGVDSQFGATTSSRPNLGSHLHQLRLSAPTFEVGASPVLVTRAGVSNPDLAELNTQSFKIGDVKRGDESIDDSASMPWRDVSSARRIDVQTEPRHARNHQTSRDRRRGDAAGQDGRGGSPLQSTEAKTNSSPNGSTRAGTDQNQQASSPSTSQGSASSDLIAVGEPGAEKAPGKGRRRHQPSSTKPSSYAVIVSGSSESASAVGKKTGVETGGSDGTDISSKRDTGKSKRKDQASESKSAASKGASSRKASARAATEKTAGGVSRRQVYREKQKGNVKDLEEKEPDVPSSNAAAISPDVKVFAPKETGKYGSSEQKHEPKSRRRRQKEPKEPKQVDASILAKTDEELTESTVETEIGTFTELSKLDRESVTSDEAAASSADGTVAEQPESVADDVVETPSTEPDEVAVAVALDESSNAEPGECKQDDIPAATSVVPEVPASVEDAQDILSSEQDHANETDQVAEPLPTDVAIDQQESFAGTAEGSSSDVDKASLSTDDEVDASQGDQHGPDGATSADESATPVPVGSTGLETKRPNAGKKAAVKEHKKEKAKKEKNERRKASKNKKEKRTPPPSVLPNDLLEELPGPIAADGQGFATKLGVALKDGTVRAVDVITAMLVSTVALIKRAVERANLKRVLSTTISYVESVLAVVFSVVLLLALHGASWFIRIHRVAFRAVLTHRHIGFCFAFLYGFPALVHHVFPWAPPWAPVCLWYAFLVQLFCTNGPTAMVTTFRILLPLVFLVEGISHHSFLLDLNGKTPSSHGCSKA